MSEMSRLRVHSISCGLAYAFLIEAPAGLYLVDAGSPGEENKVLAKMKSLGRRDLKLIWITHAHYDHYGSAAALREMTGAKIGVHPDDARFMASCQSPLGTTRSFGFFFSIFEPLLMRIWPLRPTSPDFTLKDGETLELYGLEASILHTPGHTPGHTCLLLKDGIAITGDLISTSPWPSLQHLVATDWSQLPTSLRRLQAARPERDYAGHSPRPIPGKKLQEIKP